jgi:hypothetical protein
MKRLAALLLGILPLAPAQQPPAENVLIDRLYAYAGQYRATLPSFSCDESILSAETYYRKKGSRTVRVEGTMREIRKTPPDQYDPFTERHQFTKVNGKPVKGEIGLLPYFIEGGFANLIGFHSSEQKDCFNYRITPLPDGGNFQLQIDRKDKLPDACKGILAGTHYVVVADAEGHILHSERTIPPAIADRYDEAYFAAMDYAPQQLGERTFWLPAKFSSHDFIDIRRMEASYSNCHRYTGDIRILPGVAEAGRDAKPRKPD